MTNINYIDIYVHYVGNTGGWKCVREKRQFNFNAFYPTYFLFSGTTNQIIDGLALQFSKDSTGQKELYYTVEVKFE